VYLLGELLDVLVPPRSQVLVDGGQRGLVQLPDVVGQLLYGLVAFSLARSLVPDGRDQLLDGVGNSLAAVGQCLPGVSVTKHCFLRC
jgi:hypothetical protein